MKSTTNIIQKAASENLTAAKKKGGKFRTKRLFINWIGEEGPIEGDAKILCSICSMDDDDECSCWICDRCMEKVGDDKVIFGDADQFNEAPYCPACFGILSSLGKDFDDSSAAAGARA